MPSFWLRSLDGRGHRDPLDGPLDVDVCIVGAGLTGLWTAYELCRTQPQLKVVVLEAEFVGFGASGRHGGWVSGELAGSPEKWARRHSRDAIVALRDAIRDTVYEVGRVLAREGIDCDYVAGGTLHIAQSPLEVARVQERIAAERAWGVGATDSVWLDQPALNERIRVRDALGARFSPHCARVNPAKLIDGLASAAERRGATIYESTRVTRIEPGAAHTRRGPVRARIVVRATEGYTRTLRRQRRTLAPLSSAMIVTEPLPDDLWQGIGWTNAETIADGRRLYVYLQRTSDGRIAIGGRGIPYHYGSRTVREGTVATSTVRWLRLRLGELFGPELAGVETADAWHGVLGVSRTWMPSVGLDEATGLAWAGGYVGQGVAAANLAGRTLRDLIVGQRTPLTDLPWVSERARRWEPEPLRYLGIRSVYSMLAIADRRERRTGRTAAIADVANRIAGR